MAEEGVDLRNIMKRVEKSPWLVEIYDRAVILPRWQGRRPMTQRMLVGFRFSSCSVENTPSPRVKEVSDQDNEEEEKKAGEGSKSPVMDVKPPSSQSFSLNRVEKKRQSQVKECNKKNKKPRQPPIDEEMKENEKRPRQMKIRLPPPHHPPLVFNPPDLPQEWKDFIEGELGGTEITRVCQKIVTSTDVDKHHRRFLMSEKIIQTLDFLRDDEKEVVSLPSTKFDVRAVPAMVVGPSRVKHWLSFRKWHMNKDGGKVSVMYVLTQAWNGFVDDNSLVPGHDVQVWSFRAAVEDVEDQLHMAIVILGRELNEA